MKPIAVIGAGNSGFAMAAHLRSQAEQVKLWNRYHEGYFDAVRQNGGIDAAGLVEGRFLPEVMTHDAAEALADSELIVVTVPPTVTTPSPR